MSPFLEAFGEFVEISDNFDLKEMKVNAYIESTLSELDINIKRSELKVMKESGTTDDLCYFVEEAEEGAIVKLKNAITAIIRAFVDFISDLKDRVVRVIVSKTTRMTLDKCEKKVKLNPIISKKKVKVVNKKKPLSVINKYKSIADKNISKVKAGVFKESDIEGIMKAKDNFDSDYKAVVAGTASFVTITVGALVSAINKELQQLPSYIDNTKKETNEAVENLIKSIDDPETVASIRSAATACANFRVKLGKAEANEHVDTIMQWISVLKKEVAHVKEADTINESYNDLYEMDEIMESGYDSESLLRELEDLL